MHADGYVRDSGTKQRLHQLLRRVGDIGRYTADLEKRAARGGVLVLGSRVLIKAIQFMRTIVVARLLFPHDVGQFALAASILGIAEMVIQPGLAAAVIHRDKIDRRHLDTAWTVTLTRSVLVGVVAISAAPLAGVFFASPEIVPVIRMLAVAVMINGFENIGAVLLVREVRFNRKVLYDALLVISETAAIIIGAFVFKSVWALVIGSVVNRIASVFFSYVLHPYRPRFLFDREAFFELFSFGKWVGIVGVVSYFVAQGDTLTIGRLFGPAEVGFYSLAFGLALLPAVEISKTLGGVLFPHLARLSGEERSQAFLRVVRGVFLISIPATIGLAVVGEPLVRLVYGSKWLPMLAPFYVLLLYGAIRSLSYLVEPLYMSMGRPRVVTTATSIHFLVMMASIVPLGMQFGLAGVGAAVLLGSVASFIYLMSGIRREKHVSMRSIVAAAGIPLAAAGLMAALLLLVTTAVPVATKSLLAAEIVLGVSFYCGALFIFDMFGAGTVRQTILWFKTSL